jgi:DNA-binding CsgD family transcriptional regulator
VSLLEQYNRLLLTMYGTASQAGAAEFPQFAMALLRSVLDFDFARLTSVDMTGGHATVNGSIQYRERPEMLLDWQAITRADLVLARCLAQPNRTLSFHAPALYASKRHAVMRDYANRFEHQNGLVVMAPAAACGAWDGLCFYRASAEHRFSKRDMRLVDLLAPHVVQAMRVNRLASLGAAAAAGDPNVALVCLDGQLQYAVPSFAALMRREWPDWRGAALPAQLVEALAASPRREFWGHSITVSASVQGQLLLLEARAASPLDSLTRRELTAALLFGSGQSNKVLAREMGISPNTARNFMQQVYQKLHICGKAELAVIVERHQAAHTRLRRPRLEENADER